MPLKYISVPQSIELKDLLNDAPIFVEDGKPMSISFEQFVLKILGHDSYMSSFELLRSAYAIADSVKNVQPGVTITLSEEDWKVLVDGIKKHFSSVGLVSLGLIQLMPYFDAILRASETI